MAAETQVVQRPALDADGELSCDSVSSVPLCFLSLRRRIANECGCRAVQEWKHRGTEDTADTKYGRGTDEGRARGGE